MSPAALVIEAHSNQAVARLDTGPIVRLHFPRRLGRPLPGDRVELDQDQNLAAIAPRRNEFGRGDPNGRFRPVAANLDRALIVIAPAPAPSPDLVHRYLATALIRGIEPVIVINKSDLPTPQQPPFSELDDLKGLGYRIIQCRCRPEAAVDDIGQLLASGVSLLAGQSGVGKTSLLNALVPDLEQQTSQLSRVTGKGRHTTTTATLHHLPSGAWLVDTPGVWEYGLWSMPVAELERGFPEFASFSGNCHFRNCTHQHEPRCAVREAAGAGKVPASRHAAWLRLLSEQSRLARHT